MGKGPLIVRESQKSEDTPAAIKVVKVVSSHPLEVTTFPSEMGKGPLIVRESQKSEETPAAIKVVKVVSSHPLEVTTFPLNLGSRPGSIPGRKLCVAEALQVFANRKRARRPLRPLRS